MRATSSVLLAFFIAVTRSEKAREEEKQTEEGRSDFFCYEDGRIHRESGCRFFAVVIDAGSTGTRLHLYRFVQGSKRDKRPFRTEEEIRKEVSPGLSSFASRPSSAAASVAELLHEAERHVHKQLRSQTPIVVKATAGLRLLPGDAAQNILKEVNAVVRASGFVCLNDEAVGILGGADEGIYSWLTLNLLLGNFEQGKQMETALAPLPENTVAAFDLGGGSTQVTYLSTSSSNSHLHSPDHHEVDCFGSRMRLFTHSFLGCGLQSARLGVLRVDETDAESDEGAAFSSACFPAEFHLPKWEQAQKSWTVCGLPEYSPAACLDEVRRFLASHDIMKLHELKHSSPVHLFSYYYDRARQAGLLDQDGENTGSRRSISVLRDAAQKACGRGVAELSGGKHWLPWQCLDLSYLYALLTYGYGFPDDQEVVFVKRLAGMEVSWAQGLAYSLVEEFQTKLQEDQDIPQVCVPGKELGPNESCEIPAESPSAIINATGVDIVDSLLTVISQRTTDVLQFLNLVS